MKSVYQAIGVSPFNENWRQLANFQFISEKIDLFIQLHSQHRVVQSANKKDFYKLFIKYQWIIDFGN